MIFYWKQELVNFCRCDKKLISNRDSYRRYKAINFTLLIMLIKVTKLTF